VSYEGYEKLLADPSIDAVYIPLPNALHREWVLRAAEAGKHALCEKPMAISASDARDMRAACDEAGVLLAEAYMYGHHPRYERIRGILEAGELGSIRTVVTSFTFNGSDDLDHSGFQGYPGSGALYDVGCYAIHSARLLLGMEPEAVTAHSLISVLHGDIDMSTAALVPSVPAAREQVESEPVELADR
jgi:xylose dehydrogenase (NAD/NADP)